MSRYAPIYMAAYDGPDTTLVDLELDNDTFAAGSEEGTTIGELSKMAPESTLSVTDGAGQVEISGTELVVGATPSDAGTLNVTVRETNVYGFNSPHDTEFELTVTA